ncbi:MAG: hypothetical protein VB013_06250 [Anaerolineaceae bacterium]|nr:hypothetical protein [Anaerolineaceae bacterium]
MQPEIEDLLEKLNSKEDEVRYPAFLRMQALTEHKVDWVYEVWDALVAKLSDPNSYQRNIGATLLCALSQSDSENRLAAVIDRLLACSKDEKFITSRLTLQNLWKPAWFEPQLRDTIISHLQQRFEECETEKHSNLLRQDILQSLFTLAELSHDEALQEKTLDLIQTEKDEKSRKSYLALKKKN